MRQSKFIRQITGLFLLTIYISGNFSAFGQNRRGAATPDKAQVAGSQNKGKSCNSGFSGTVNYTKTVSTSSSGRFGSLRTMRRVYQTSIRIRDDGRQTGTAQMSPDGGINGSFNFTGRAEGSESENLNQLDVSEKDEYCNVTIKGAGKAQRVRCESKLDRRLQASGAVENAGVFIGLRGRTMLIGLTNLPKLSGTVSQESASSCTGTCTKQTPIGSSSSVETHNQGETRASTDEGVIQFNPESFNRLSGSWTRTSSNGNTVENFQWNLSRCAPPLEIINVRFEHKRVPNPNNWVGVDSNTGTVDGNLVKIKAKVANNGGDTAYANVKFSETKSGEILPDGTVSVALKPGETRDVEYEWDTNGYAWDENRKNQSEREIRAEIEGDAKTEKIKILPKPVILVHGLWSNAAAWAEYPVYLREAHSFAWEAYAVGSDPSVAKMSTGDHPGNYKPTNTVFQNAQELGKQIKFVRERKNAWHVDVVAHSMGGLISRQYINAFMAPVWDNKPEISHLVMLGTPNMGSPCADLVDGIFTFFEQTDMNAMRELRPSVVADFNRRTTNRKGVKFSILIGYAVPRTCHDEDQGDGVVPIQSARFNISDRDYVFRDHISLTDDVNFKSFVLPRLAVGPKKARLEKTVGWLENPSNDTFASADEDAPRNDRYGFNRFFQKAAFESETTEQSGDTNSPDLTAREKVVLQPKQAREIEIPANANGKTGVVIVAPTGVVATLTDAGGAILGKSEGGMDAMKNPFRTIFADKKTSGMLKLKLENFDSKETTVFIAVFNPAGKSADFSVEAGKPTPAGTVSLQAKWTENKSPVLNAKIVGRINERAEEIAFYDDGKHGDGAAGDGIYGATVAKLAPGEHFLEATAESNGQTRIAVAKIGGAAPTAAKPAARRGK